MIVEFSVKNFRSIKNLQTISFVATSLRSDKLNRMVDASNIVKIKNQKLLKTIGIYGPNASGKSNILKALAYCIWSIRRSPSPDNDKGNFTPFLYQSNPKDTESYFQIVYLAKNIKYRYGFTIGKENITNEWLYQVEDINIQTPLFLRTRNNKIKFYGAFSEEAKLVPPLEHEHVLFLTHAASYKKGIAFNARSFFMTKVIAPFRQDLYRKLTLRFINDGLKQDILSFLSEFNLHYKDIIIGEEYKGDIIPLDKINLVKEYMLNGKYQQVPLNLAYNESTGTQKLFDLSAALVLALKQGALMWIDEIDSHFHPSLVITLIQLFNDKKTNPYKAQLLFASHDTNLMNPHIMRRDQFYFTEKDNDDATSLYSLADLKGIKNDADFAKEYLAGFYGAVPLLNNFLNTQ